jgi:hypothetical protein
VRPDIEGIRKQYSLTIAYIDDNKVKSDINMLLDYIAVLEKKQDRLVDRLIFWDDCPPDGGNCVHYANSEQAPPCKECWTKYLQEKD